jgi:PTH1 family peptidyl-tRNA hydrolase
MIIVGLGNPGPEYTGTRHNVGFAVLDQLALSLGISWSTERNTLAAREGDVWLLKPQTFMNHSGQALRDFLIYKNISTAGADLHQHLLVIHDELDFAVGQWKMQRDRSSAHPHRHHRARGR